MGDRERMRLAEQCADREIVPRAVVADDVANGGDGGRIAGRAVGARAKQAVDRRTLLVNESLRQIVIEELVEAAHREAVHFRLAVPPTGPAVAVNPAGALGPVAVDDETKALAIELHRRARVGECVAP